MEDGGDPTSYGTVTAERAFSLVGNEIRQQILLALSEPGPDGIDTRVMSFSELYHHIDANINTSQFNYHLQQLLGHFIESREAETAHPNAAIGEGDGYALRPEGLLLVWTVRSGSTTGEPDLDPFPAGFSCHHCDTSARAIYENAIFKIECPSCTYLYEYNLTPPGVVHGEATPDAILDRVATYNRAYRTAFARGGCPLCGTDVATRYLDPAETNYPRADLREAFVHATCTHCGFIDYLTVGEYLLENAALLSICFDNGIDLLDGPIWKHEFVTTDSAVTVESTDPWRVVFEVAFDDSSVAIALDNSLDVAEIRAP